MSNSQAHASTPAPRPDDLNALRTVPPPGADRAAIGHRLIRRALDRRDMDAARLVAEWMDADLALDEALYKRLQRALLNQPDAVYSFIRAIVSEGRERAAVWRDRLKVAALASLRVAIVDGDGETALNWLRLIAREPFAYDLTDVFTAGVAAAQSRAYNDPLLARALVMLAAKRSPAVMEELLEDAALRALLPDTLCLALRDGIGDATTLFQQFGGEVFLATLGRASVLGNPDIFTPETIDQVWLLVNGDNGSAAAAEKLLKLWVANGLLDWMPFPALSRALALALLNKRDDVFYGLVNRAVSRPDLPQLLSVAIANSGRSVTDALVLTAQMIALGYLDQQGAAELYVGLLDSWLWNDATFSMVEGLARILQQHHDIDIAEEALWNMIALAAERKEDFETRTALRRLTSQLDDVEDEMMLIEEVGRLFMFIHWNGTARAQLIGWWREYMHTASVARLQRMERLLTERISEGRKISDDLRAILSTTLAFRRMVGKRTMPEFAEDVATTYAILQALLESFDPSTKRSLQFDPATFREEIESRSEEVPSPERKILANNMKELAQIVTLMAENRSKGGVVRRAEDVDRLLATGEQLPHSAVDMLKWMAGYLSGSQQEADEE